MRYALHHNAYAGKPREAIDMYLHNQDWTAAMRVAERCEQGAVDDIYLAQVCRLVSPSLTAQHVAGTAGCIVMAWSPCDLAIAQGIAPFDFCQDMSLGPAMCPVWHCRLQQQPMHSSGKWLRASS